MLQISAELLAMAGESAVLIKNGKVVFANNGARVLLGRDCEGKSLRAILGDELAEIQSASFIGDFKINGKNHIVRVRSIDNVKAFFISESNDKPNLISDAFIYSLRSCLMSINMTLSMLHSNEELPASVKHNLTEINHEAFKIKRILSNISTIRSLWDESLVFSPIFINLSEMLAGHMDSIRTLFPGLEIRFSAPEPVMLYADPALIETLMLNLLSNCCLHAKDCTRISISLIKLKEKAILCVDDDGCGISADELHEVFDRYRHGFALRDMGQGAGLGLTAARLIANLHGGTLLMESRQDIGTAVRVSLSLSPYADAPLKQPEIRPDLSITNLLTGLADCLPSEFYSEKFAD